MLMSRDCALAWKRLWEPRPQTPIEDPNTWHTYTERLYHVPNQSPIPMPSTPRPTTGTLFTASRVMKVITNLQHRKSMDRTGLRAEHMIYARECLAPFLALIFNRALAEGFLPQWTMNTVAPIYRGGNPMDPNTYRTIMIGHTLAKLYGAVTEVEINDYMETLSLRAPAQDGFRRAFSTIDHIFILRCLID